MNTVFKNKTGSYAPTELSIVVWSNQKGRGRALETMTTDDSTMPIVFPTAYLKKKREWSLATFVSTSEEVFDLLPKSTRRSPLIIPMPIAKSALGWENFYIPTEYVEE